jgi:hypothetical protein
VSRSCSRFSRMRTRILRMFARNPATSHVMRLCRNNGWRPPQICSFLLPYCYFSPLLRMQNFHRIPSLLIKFKAICEKVYPNAQRVYQPERTRPGGRDRRNLRPAEWKIWVALGVHRRWSGEERRGKYIKLHISHPHYIYIKFLQNGE